MMQGTILDTRKKLLTVKEVAAASRSYEVLDNLYCVSTNADCIPICSEIFRKRYDGRSTKRIENSV